MDKHDITIHVQPRCGLTQTYRFQQDAPATPDEIEWALKHAIEQVKNAGWLQFVEKIYVG